MADRELNFGADATDADWQIRDNDPANGGDLVIEHLPTGAEFRYDTANDAWVPNQPIGTSANPVPGTSYIENAEGTGLQYESVNIVQARFGSAEQWRVVDSEAEFATALSELGDGGLIMPTENVEVTGNHSFNFNLTIIGPSAARGAFPESWISGGATLTANGRLAIANSSLGTCEIILNATRSSIIGTNNQGGTDVTANDNRLRFVANNEGSVTFASGTDFGIVDGCSDVSVTDNGTNTVGDIA